VPERHFTPDEANAVLPVVRPLVVRMAAVAGELAAAHARRSALEAPVGSNGGGIDARELAEASAAVTRLRAELGRALEAVREHGVQVKDPALGLIDFPALRRGEEVLLCWRLGEERVAYWHTLDGGFAGRRPLPLD
jgi:hypothetical protein